MDTYMLIEHDDTTRFRIVHDDDYRTRGSYAYDTEAETRAAEDDEISKLESGEWVVVGCIVEKHCSKDCPCKGCPGWVDTDSLWGIVIEDDEEKIREFVESEMEF